MSGIFELMARVNALEARVGATNRDDLVVDLPPTPPGFEVAGTPGPGKAPFAREYDENGVLVEAGSETGGDPSTIDAGHTIRPTWDYPRIAYDALL